MSRYLARDGHCRTRRLQTKHPGMHEAMARSQRVASRCERRRRPACRTRVLHRLHARCRPCGPCRCSEARAKFRGAGSAVGQQTQIRQLVKIPVSSVAQRFALHVTEFDSAFDRGPYNLALLIGCRRSILAIYPPVCTANARWTSHAPAAFIASNVSPRPFSFTCDLMSPHIVSLRITSSNS